MVSTHEFEKQKGDNIVVYCVRDLWFEAGRSGIREEVNIEDFLSHTPWGDEPITPYELAAHIKRVKEADISFPIIISPDGDVMDGYHRIVRCHMMEYDTIPAVRLTEWPEPKEIKRAPSEEPPCIACGGFPQE